MQMYAEEEPRRGIRMKAMLPPDTNYRCMQRRSLEGGLVESYDTPRHQYAEEEPRRGIGRKL